MIALVNPARRAVAWIASKIPIHDRSPCDENDHAESFIIDFASSDWLGILFLIIIEPYDELGNNSEVIVPVREGSSSVLE
jgi:hypothetical protein